MRTFRNGCDGCGSLEQVIQRTLAGETHCAVGDCLLEKFIQSARGQIERYHVGAFPFLLRIVSDPMDVAVIAAGDLLTKEGVVRGMEIEAFLGMEGSEYPIRKGILKQQWERYVSVRLQRTLSDLREEDNAWYRKIRSNVEHAIHEKDGYHRIPHRSPALYYRPKDGDPEAGLEPPSMDRILSDLFGRRLSSQPVPELIKEVYDLLAGQRDRRRALSVSELTYLIVSYHGAYLEQIGDPHVEQVATELDDTDRIIIERVVAALREGRLAYYREQGIYSDEECESLVSMLRVYLEDIRNKKAQTLDHYLRLAFPHDTRRLEDAKNRNRISNLLQSSRTIANKRAPG